MLQVQQAQQEAWQGRPHSRAMGCLLATWAGGDPAGRQGGMDCRVEQRLRAARTIRRRACTVQAAAGQLHGWQPSLNKTHANPADPHVC